MELKDEWITHTVGTNLLDIRYIVGIDPYTTISNDIVAMYETFGIEVARAIIVNELYLAFKGESKVVNYQHIALLADMMTANGYLMSVDRHGVGRSDNDPFSKASFERTVEVFLTAAAFGEVDHMKSVSSRVAAGLPIKGGTGYCDVVLNTDMVQNSEFLEEYEQRKEPIDISGTSIMDDLINRSVGAGFVPE